VRRKSGSLVQPLSRNSLHARVALTNNVDTTRAPACNEEPAPEIQRTSPRPNSPPYSRKLLQAARNVSINSHSAFRRQSAADDIQHPPVSPIFSPISRSRLSLVRVPILVAAGHVPRQRGGLGGGERGKKEKLISSAR
jgi:hypothetical protein